MHFGDRNAPAGLSGKVWRPAHRRAETREPTLDEAPLPLFRAVSGGRVPVRSGAGTHRTECRTGPAVQGASAETPSGAMGVDLRQGAGTGPREPAFERTRIFGYARGCSSPWRIVWPATGHLEARGRFFLTVDELLAAVEGSAVNSGIADLVALRRKDQENAARLPDPPERILVRGSVLDSAGRLAVVTGAGETGISADDRQRKGNGVRWRYRPGGGACCHDPAESRSAG